MTLNPNPLNQLKYRSDIDGLRAISIFSVVLYHAFPEYFPGGFIGVDVFFVISGFLISCVIFDNLNKNNFSFIDFYARRIRRIFPALILVLLASILLGGYILSAEDYKLLGLHIAGGSGFIANLIYWRESGYFDNLAELKPLLHLWSLGIEEQFYIIWPLILYYSWLFRLPIFKIILGACIASFVFNLYGSNHFPIANFYLPLTRFWELLIGALLAWITVFPTKLPKFLKYSKNYANFLSSLGFGLFVIGLFYINNKSIFPGSWALLPTIGAALMIKAGSYTWFNRNILGNRILVWFGLISYPLYLWHWPLLSFTRIYEGGTPDLKSRIFVIILSVILSWFTYRFIEKSIRFDNGVKLFSTWFITRKLITISLIVAMILIGVTGYLVNYQAYKIVPKNIGPLFSGGQSPFLNSKTDLNRDRFHPLIDIAGTSYINNGLPKNGTDYFGFRNNSNAYIADPNYHYIILTGNSEAVGYHHNISIAENLENILNNIQDKKKYKVVNLAMNSATTAQEINYFVNLGFNLSPDFVISHSFAMDFFYGQLVTPEFKYLGLFYTHPQIEWSKKIYGSNVDHSIIESAWAKSNPEQYLIDGYQKNIRRYKKIAESSGAKFILGIQKFTPSNENDESSFGRWGQVKSAYKTIKDDPKKYFQDTTYIDFNEVPGLLMAEKNDPIHTTNQSAYLIAKIYSELILSRITGASSK